MQLTGEPRRRVLVRRFARGTVAVVALAVLGGIAVRIVLTTTPDLVRVSATALEPVPAQPRIMMLGDSITSGVGSTSGTGYRLDLAVRLSDASVVFDFVGSQGAVGPGLSHEGHPRWRIDEIDARVGQWMVDARPDVVLLNIGTNDYVQRRNPVQAPVRLSRLIDKILASSPTVRVVVAKLLVSMGPERGRGIADFNAVLPATVAAKGPRVTLADLSRVSNRNTTDGVHPTGLGYRQMSYQWFQALRSVLPGGKDWPLTTNPYPTPTLRLIRSAAVVRSGSLTLLTAQLTGVLTATDLGRVPVQLVYRRLGTSTWTVLQTVRTSATGRAVFTQRVTRAGSFMARVSSGVAAGSSPPVPIAVRA